MPDEDTPEVEGGLEPAVEETGAPAEAPEAVADAPITFTAEQLAEHLPQFQERFLAHHDPAEALALYGQRDRNVQAALTRYTQGAPTDDDIETLREGGYEIPEPQEESPQMWDAPWAPMEDWNRVEAYAQSEVPQHRQMAVEAVWDHPSVPQEYKDWALGQWAQIDNFGAQRFYTDKQNEAREARFQEMLAERDAAHQEALTPIQQRAAQADFNEMKANVTVLASRANAEIPNFGDHEEAVIKLLEERANYDPTYLPRLFALDMEQQIQEVYDLTGVVAYRAIPAVQAAAAEAAATTEQAKLGAAGQRGRAAAGASGSPQSDLKRRHLESFERMKDVDVTV